MANISGIGIKYTVTKLDDIEQYLDSEEQGQLACLLGTVRNVRSCLGKKSNVYLVINTDEPYADEVIEIMKRHGHWG